MKFDLWDVEINRYLGQYEDEADALVLVRTLMNHYGPAYADDLELGGITSEGEILESLSGPALIARADEILSRRQTDRGQEGVVIGSHVPHRGAKREESMVATAPSAHQRVGEARNRKRHKH